MESNYQPLISVIVPIYNRERTLDVCIKSILASEYKNIELILVDDGSTDSSREICQRYADADDRIKLICQVNKGVSIARNIGIKTANGEWLSFVDSDDAILPDRYQKLVDADIKYSDLVMIGRCRGIVVDNIPKSVSPPVNTFKRRIEGNSEIIKYLFGDFKPFQFSWYFCTDKLFRKSILQKYELSFREDLSLDEDQIFVLNYLKHTKSFYYDNTPCYLGFQWDFEIRNYGLGTQLRTPEETLKVLKANYEAFEHLLAVCPDKGLKAYEVNYILDRPITRILYKYCLIENISKYGYRKLRKFTKEQIVPFMEKEKGNGGVRRKMVAYFNDALFKQSFLFVYCQLLIERNLLYYCPGLLKFVVFMEKRRKVG